MHLKSKAKTFFYTGSNLEENAFQRHDLPFNFRENYLQELGKNPLFIEILPLIARGKSRIKNTKFLIRM